MVVRAAHQAVDQRRALQVYTQVGAEGAGDVRVTAFIPKGDDAPAEKLTADDLVLIQFLGQANRIPRLRIEARVAFGGQCAGGAFLNVGMGSHGHRLVGCSLVGAGDRSILPGSRSRKAIAPRCPKR